MLQKLLHSTFAIIAFLVMASCQKTELNPVEISEMPIAVSADTEYSSVLGKTSAATLVDNFSVFAYYTATTDFVTFIGSNTAEANWMNDILVIKNASDTYEYSPLSYWPLDPATNISFFAYSPGNSSQCTVVSPSSVNNQGLPIFNYTIDTVNQTEDLLVSDGLLNQNSGSGSLVFSLKHVLSKINFTFKSDLSNAKILSIHLKNVLTSGTFSSWGMQWSGQNTYADLQQFSIAIADQDLTSTAKALTEQYIVLPHVFDALNPPVFTIEYELDNDYYSKDFSPNTEWLKGENYVYNITLTGNQIDVVADVQPWITNDTSEDVIGQENQYINLSTRDLDLSVDNQIFYTTNFPSVAISDTALYTSGVNSGSTFVLSTMYTVADSGSDFTFTSTGGNTETFTCYLECFNNNGAVLLKIPINVTP